MDWSQFFHDWFVIFVGISGWEIGKHISHMRKTWKCPQCEAPRKFSITSPNKQAREEIAQSHIQQFHSQ
jgi:hypothetical protein